jgi:hypothetical protein
VYLASAGVIFGQHNLRGSFKELKTSFSFFVNALFGFYASRIDSLLTVFFFTNLQIATYQIAFNFVYLFQGLSNYIFYTYSFHFYRLTKESKNRLIKNYILIGAGITFVFLIATDFIFRMIYHIALGSFIHLILAGFVFLSFVHQPYIYSIYNSKKTILISAVSFASILLFGLFLIIFNAMPGSNIFNNFIYASALAQISRSGSFVIVGRTYLSHMSKTRITGIPEEEHT